jgi:DNA-binding transcriptional LysR family regulator
MDIQEAIMEIKQLRTFQVASTTLNFTHTAKALNYAQSSVTAQIKSLELELGTSLFERLGKRLILTQAGHQLKNYADHILHLSHEAKNNISSNQLASTITIGAQESQCTYRLPFLLKEFKTQYPLLNLVFKPAHSDAKAADDLVSGKIDIAFLIDTVKTNQQLHTETLLKEKLTLVASPQNTLSVKSKILAEDLENETYLLTEKGCSYRVVFEQILHSRGLSLDNTIEFVSIEAIKKCVIANLGIALLPEMTVKNDIEKGELVEVSWDEELPLLMTKMVLHKDKYISAPLRAFMELTREHFSVHTSPFQGATYSY